MSLKPWYQVVQPREDLREGRPLDASEFAVHLDHIREERETVSPDYLDPKRFFERNYWTRSMKEVVAQAARRLSGITVETSPVFNLATQFGGGKTHALTALYHLAKAGPESEGWRGVRDMLRQADVRQMPRAAVAVFVGTEFDSLTGRTDDGGPVRRTPWGEIAWQLGGAEAFAKVARHDEEGVAPAGDVIRSFLPTGPALILMDELVNYVSRYRKAGLAAQFYNFLQTFSEEVRGRDNTVLCVSIPASELEMTAEDWQDYERMRKLLERVGKGMVMSAEEEVAEIIRRRLFEWGGLPREAKDVAQEYADWVSHHRDLVSISPDDAYQQFESTYPFHPAVLSVFDRKWRSLQHFQQTRGVLRLLALWVSWAYQEDHRQVFRDPLLTLGTAPLEYPAFRTAMLEQLGSQSLEGPVTTDIAGSSSAHAVRLDHGGDEVVRKVRLHRKVATSILFESNGGQTTDQATVPELRFAVAGPDLEIAHVETALDDLTGACYYLTCERNRYKFTTQPNLNKVFTDRRAGIDERDVQARVREEVEAVFQRRPRGLDLAPLPRSSAEVPSRAVLTMVVLAPDMLHPAPETTAFVEQLLRESGSSGRTFKSALIIVAPAHANALSDHARRLLAWDAIDDDAETCRNLDEQQRSQLKEHLHRAARDLTETVWRSYRHVLLLGPDNAIKHVDLGHITSSAATTMAELVVTQLRHEDEITDGVGVQKLIRSWPAIERWSTKALRDAFYASPKLPRLLDANVLKRTIADGVSQGHLGYGIVEGDGFQRLYFDESLHEDDVEFSDSTVVLRAEDARRYVEPRRVVEIRISPPSITLKPGQRHKFNAVCIDQHGHRYHEQDQRVAWSSTGGVIEADGWFTAADSDEIRLTAALEDVTGVAQVTVQSGVDPPLPPPPQEGFHWKGEVPPLKWTIFYTKVISRFRQVPGLRVVVEVAVPPDEAVGEAALEETKIALGELGLDEDQVRP